VGLGEALQQVGLEIAACGGGQAQRSAPGALRGLPRAQQPRVIV
jgi:hypothetical protein